MSRRRVFTREERDRLMAAYVQTKSSLADIERKLDAAPAADRREQRKLDQAAGLVPFAVKLDQRLVVQLIALAASRGLSMTEVVDELLRKGLGIPPGGQDA
jgi:transposase-like protein